MSTTASGTPCQRWTGALDANGYGVVKVDGRKRGAHVVVCEQTHGPVPRGWVVRHLCADISTKRLGADARADRACVNARHLRAGTQRENALDRERAARVAARRARPLPPGRRW